MPWEQIALTLLSITSAVLGWLLRELWGAVKELRKDVQQLEVKLADNYVKNSAFDNAVGRILTAIDSLREDIARKEDRK